MVKTRELADVLIQRFCEGAPEGEEIRTEVYQEDDEESESQDNDSRTQSDLSRFT